MKTILDDLVVPCRRCSKDGVPQPATNDTPNRFMCNACDGRGLTPFRPACRVYCDMDGVLVDFDGGFEAKFGCHPASLSDDDMWARINADHQYWSELPVYEGATAFFQYIGPLNPPILTACPQDDYRAVALAKKYHIRKHFAGDPTVLPVAGAKAKPLFMHNVGDILIDDFLPNIERWHDAGGVGILHAGDFAATQRALVAALKEKYQNRQ